MIQERAGSGPTNTCKNSRWWHEVGRSWAPSGRLTGRGIWSSCDGIELGILNMCPSNSVKSGLRGPAWKLETRPSRPNPVRGLKPIISKALPSVSGQVSSLAWWLWAWREVSGWRGTEAAPLTGLWVHGLWGEGEGRVTVASRVSGVVTLDQVLSVSSGNSR